MLSSIVDAFIGAALISVIFHQLGLLTAPEVSIATYILFPTLLLILLELYVRKMARDAKRWAETQPTLDSLREISEFEHDYDDVQSRVDPWVHQRSLMEMSDQRLPKHATLTRESLLYFALICEELGELAKGLAAPLERHLTTTKSCDAMQLCSHSIVRVQAVHGYMTSMSRNIRNILDSHQSTEFDVPLLMDEASEILDGTNDITVVNAGFSMACGLPGSAGYLEVTGSNYSKANPDTGRIDKDPSGKWIKGRDYVAPDLERVLREHGSVIGA